jgi:hypothetical protein
LWRGAGFGVGKERLCPDDSHKLKPKPLRLLGIRRLQTTLLDGCLGHIPITPASSTGQRKDFGFAKCLDPNSYAVSQKLAEELLDKGSAGVVYPSVRHSEGTCIACFRAALVNNVRKGGQVSVVFENALATAVIHSES